MKRGQLLARIESSESLQVYPVYSTVSGVIAERNGNPGDVTFDRPLYVITDPAATTVEFNIFPRDLGSIRPGQQVTIGVRPESISVNASEKAGLPATVETVERLGNITFAYLNIGLPDLLTVQIIGEMPVTNGQDVQLSLTPSALHVFDQAGTALR